MSNLEDIRAAIAGRVRDSFAEIDARPYFGGASTLPAFYLEAAAPIPYRTTARKADFELRGVLLIADVLTEEAGRQMDTYLEPGGLKAAIEGTDRTLGGLVDQVFVRDRTDIGLDEYQTVGAWGAALTIQILGRTS